VFGLGAFSVGSHPLAKHSNKRDSAVTLRLDPAEMLALYGFPRRRERLPLLP